MYQEGDDEKQKQLVKKLCNSEGLAFDSDDKRKSLVHLCDVTGSDKRGHISLLLKTQGLKVDNKDGEGFSALMITVEFGHMDCLHTFLDANTNTTPVRSGVICCPPPKTPVRDIATFLVCTRKFICSYDGVSET